MTLPSPSVAGRSPIPAVGCVVWRGDDVLLIKRGKPPREGQWSIPGGRVEWGESLTDAAVREVREETGVEIANLRLCDALEAVFRDAAGAVERHLVLIDYVADWAGGEPRAGDDAADARFVPYAEIGALGMWDETLRVIAKARSQRAAS